MEFDYFLSVKSGSFINQQKDVQNKNLQKYKYIKQNV